MAQSLRVLLVEDSKVLTERLTEAIRQISDVELIGTADTEALPDAVPPKAAAANSGAEDAKKNTDKAATTKPSEAANRSTQSSPAPHVTTARPRHHVDQGNGAPRPPLPIGPAT